MINELSDALFDQSLINRSISYVELRLLEESLDSDGHSERISWTMVSDGLYDFPVLVWILFKSYCISRTSLVIDKNSLLIN